MASQIPTLTLNDGNQFPILGFGTWAWEGSGERDQIVNSVYDAIAAGYRHIDTAWIYGVEKQVGVAVRKAIDEGLVEREEIVIVTKVWMTYYAKDRVKLCAQESNDNLGLGYIDVLLLHFPIPMKNLPSGPLIFPVHPDGSFAYDDDIDIYNETWKAMEELVDSGVTKSIGVSNFSGAQIETLVKGSRIKPVTNQVECHPLLPQEELLSVCKKHNVILTAYSPFAGSPSPQPDGSFKASDLKKKLFESEVVKGLALKYNKTEGQILLKYHVARGIAVVPKSVTKSRIIQNTQIFDFELEPEEVQSLNAMQTNERMFTGEGLEKSKYFPFSD